MANGYVGQINIGNNSYLIGSTLLATSSTLANEPIKEATLQTGASYSPAQGISVHVKFTYENTITDSSLQLKIGTTQRQIINPNGALAWAAGSIITFTDDGNNWVINSSAIDGSSIQNLSLGNITNEGKLASHASQAVVTDASAMITAMSLAVNDPTSDGNAISFIDTISQDSQGKISPTKKTVQSASRTQAGVIQLPSGSTTTRFLREDGSWTAPPNDDTHHEAHLITGASAAATSNAVSDTNDIFLNLIENSTVRNSHEIIGSGSVTVASDASGKITITGNTSITPGNGLINGTTGNSQAPITSSGTISIKEGGVTNAMLAGSIANAKLANSSINIAGTSVSLGSTITAATLRTNLGLSAALRFIGKASTAMSEESTTTVPTITGVSSYTPIVGDVVLDNSSDSEYVCVAVNNGTYTWERLGRDSAWALDNAVIHNTLLSAEGDIIYASEANNPARLAIGTDGQFLTVSSRAPTWTSISKTTVGLENVTNHAQVTSLQWDTTNKKITYKVSEGSTATDVVEFAAGSSGRVTLTAAANKLTIEAADKRVSQTPLAYNGTNADQEYAVLFKNTGNAYTTENAGVKFAATENKRVTINPSTGTITAAKFVGDIALANVTGADDLTAIEALDGTSGFLKKTAANTWTLDTNTYLTSQYTTHLYVNATSSGAASNAATTNTTTYIHLYDDTTKRDTIQLKGADGATVTATNGKVITITSKKYKSTGSADAVTSMTLGYTVDTTANTETVGTTATQIGYVDSGILYIKSIKYGTTSVSTGVSEDTTA